MKKLLAVVLAAATVASLGVTSFAADADYGFIIAGKAKYDDGSTTIRRTDKVLPDKTLYFQMPAIEVVASNTTHTLDADLVQFPADSKIKETAAFDTSTYLDSSLWKIKTDKGSTNSKMIKSVKVVDTSVDGKRGPWIEVKLKADWTDSKDKIAPFVTLTTKKNLKADATVAVGADAVTIPAGTSFECNIYMVEEVVEAPAKDVPNTGR